MPQRSATAFCWGEIVTPAICATGKRIIWQQQAVFNARAITFWCSPLTCTRTLGDTDCALFGDLLRSFRFTINTGIVVMFEAARVGDDISPPVRWRDDCRNGVSGLIAAARGILAGAMFIAGLGASCLSVGVLLVGASLAVGYYTGELATAARDSIADAGASV